MNKSLLKSKMVLVGLTQEELSSKTNISKAQLSLKMNNKILFNLREVREITKLLNLNSDEVVEIFLNQKFGNTKQKGKK